jgi:biofilm PGA synthesis lipoprotein PgaB
VSQMQLLQGMGAVNFGYYPDDFSADHPEGDLVYVGISLANYPYGN